MSKCPSEAPPASAVLSGVKHVIAVGAGKGGVGKSTIAALLAVGLNRKGYRVGLLDADVYGPSLPKITGSEGAQPDISDDGLIVPPVKHGIRIMSMGYLVPPDEAVIWRGPMAQKYVKELLERGDWGELDFLLIDLPPGTGDIPLTLAQTVPLAGMVIVCTPQDVALADAVKAVQMYRRLDVKLLGMIENMSFYVCPACGSRDEIFGHGGAEAAARRLELAFLGAIPLNITIRRNGDAGALLENFTTADPPVVQALENTVERLIEQIDRPDEPDPAPPQASGD